MQKSTLNLATPTPISQPLVGVIVITTIVVWVIAILGLGYSIFAKKTGLSQKFSSFLNSPREISKDQNISASGELITLTPSQPTTTLSTITPMLKNSTNTSLKKKVISTPTQVKYYQYTYPTSSIKIGSYVLPTYPPFEVGNSDFAKKVESEQTRMHEEFEKMKTEICAKSPSLCD